MLSMLIAAATILPFNDGWEFRREGESEWKAVTLPHDAAHCLGYDERADPDQGFVPSPKTVVYRKVFAKPEGVGSLSLRFDGVYMDSEVVVNGRVAGGRRIGYLPFEVPLDISVPTNVVEVRCNAAAPNTRWYAGAGILRDVWLVRRNRFSIDPEDVAVTTELRWDGSAVVRVKVDGAKVVSPKGGVLKIRHPKLWTPETPNLQTISVTARNLRRECDTIEVRYGIRTVEFTKDRGMLLNGKPYRIKGVCRHDTYGALGAAFNEAALRRELSLIKEMGVNAIRTAHNPFSPRFYDICDEMGFLVKDEAFDEWRIPHTKYGYSRFFDECWERDLRDFVRRDRNHPCVVLWSIGNEIPDHWKGTEGAALTRRMVDVVHSIDKTRPVTAGICQPAAAYTNGVMAALDVVGLNYNADWYAKLKGWKPVFGSETAPSLAERDTYLFEERDGRMVPVQARGHNECAYSPKAFTWAAPAEVALKAQIDSPWSAGEFAWCTFDYMGEPNHYGRRRRDYWPARSSYWGLCDLAGMPKDRYYLYRSRWSDKPTLHLMPDWTHPGCEGKVFPVWCYTNAKEAELFLNGRSQGVRRFADTSDLHLSWDVAYEPGSLEVRATMPDGTVAVDRRITAGPAESLREARLFEFDGVVFLRYDAVDARGVHVIACDAPVDISVSGGELLGADNGCTTDHDSFVSPRRSLYRGSIVVMARKTSERFRVTVGVDFAAACQKDR